MPVDVTDDFIWVAIRDAGTFVQDSFRQKTLSEDQGIHARIGKLQSDPEGGMTVQAYYFDKSKWNVDEAKKWVADHRKSSGQYERRDIDPVSCEMRLHFEKSGPKITGYAAVFNKIAEIRTGYREQIAPGAFSDSILRDDIRALFNHNPDALLGRNTAGTLRLWEDAKGLGYEIIADPDDPDAQKLIRKIKRGDISQSSFGFNIIKRKVETDEARDGTFWTIQKARLFDVSPVTFPAYSETEAHVRMTKFDRLYLVEDEVIEVQPVRAEVQPPSDEELFKRIEDLKKKVS